MAARAVRVRLGDARTLELRCARPIVVAQSRASFSSGALVLKLVKREPRAEWGARAVVTRRWRRGGAEEIAQNEDTAVGRSDDGLSDAYSDDSDDDAALSFVDAARTGGGGGGGGGDTLPSSSRSSVSSSSSSGGVWSSVVLAWAAAPADVLAIVRFRWF